MIQENRRKKKDEEVSVSGAVGKVIDLAFNPSREKIREMTMVDRIQARNFPLLDMINKGRQYCIEVATYLEDPKQYKKLFGEDKPKIPNLLDEFLFRTAQWQKSIAGKNLEKATDIALAEIEAQGEGEEDVFKEDAWKE